MTKRTVYIVGGGQIGYSDMFLAMGWELADNIQEANLVQFTGGEDVTPSFYNQHPHPRTSNNLLRDERERLYFLTAQKNNIPTAGICRGGQFLNVMCGGELWQHVDNHGREHIAKDMHRKKELIVTSTHHQMMCPSKRTVGNILLYAIESERKEKGRPLSSTDKSPLVLYGHTPDIEAIHYPRYNSLCFQPHPEYPDKIELRDLYFEYIEEYLLPN